MTHDQQPSTSQRELARRISEAIVALIRDATGRGPVSCRVTIDGDTVLAVMRDALTKGEQTLVDRGHQDEVLALRRAYQEVLRADLSHAVERITRRRVHTFMSANHTDPDRSAEIFLLEDLEAV